MTDIWKMQLQHLTDLHFLIDSGGKITMEIITKTEGNKATMEISGWLDTQTAPQLGEAQVILAYKKMAQKDGFKIINVSDEVYDVFSLTGFDSKIDIQKK